MTELALLLLVAAIGYGISRWSGIPVIPLLLGLGMVLSFSGVVKNPGMTIGAGIQDDPLFFMLELGLTVLVFASGVELNPQRFRRQRRAVLWVGLLQFVVMGLSGYLGARLLGFAELHAVYLGFAVSASSTIVVLRQLQVSQQSFEPHGRMVIGVLLLQDGLTIAVLVALSHSGGGFGWLVSGYAWTLLMAVVAWFMQWRGARWLIERCGGDEESMLLTVLTFLFLFLGAAELAGLPVVIGAFLAGYAFSSFPVSGLVGSLLQSLTDFFRAIFFVALGALVTLPNLGSIGSAITLAFLVILITPPLVAAVAEWMGFTSRPAIESGLILAQTSEYSMILGLIGMRLGHLTGETFAVIVLMAVATMTCTPLLARDTTARWLMRWHPLGRRRRNLPRSECQNHVLILGFGASGMYVLKPLLAAGAHVLVVDEDPAVIIEMDRLGVPVLRGDGADEITLDRAGARSARLIIASMRRVSDAKKVLAYAPGRPVLVRVFEDQDADLIARHGGIPVSNAAAAEEAFMQWMASR